MNIKIQSKPLFACLITILSVLALIMSGIGIALASPDCDHPNLQDNYYGEGNAYSISENVNLHSVWYQDNKIDPRTGYLEATGNNGNTYKYNCEDCGRTVERKVFVKFKEDVVEGNCINQGKGTASFDVYVDKDGSVEAALNSLSGYVDNGRKFMTINDNSDNLEYLLTKEFSYVCDSAHKLDQSTKRAAETRKGSIESNIPDWYVEGYSIINPAVKYAYDCSVCGKEQVDYNFTSTAYPTSIEYIWNDGNNVVCKNGMNIERCVNKNFWNDDYSQYTCAVNVTFSDGSTVSDDNPILESLDEVDHDGWTENPFGWFNTSDWTISKIAAPIYYVNSDGESRCQTSWVYMYKVGDKTYGTLTPTDADAEEFEEAVDNGEWVEETEPSEPTVPEDPGNSDKVSCTISLEFRATGIQTTSFNDYKEAMAALNGN